MSVIEAALMNTARASFGLLAAYTVKTNCLFTVDGGERGVLFQRFATPFGAQGVVQQAYKPGTYFMIPWLQAPTTIDVKARPKFEKAVTATKDLQQVNIGVRILHRPLLEGDMPPSGEVTTNAGSITELYRKFGVGYDERILPSIMNEVMKTTVAQYNAEELLTKREAVSTHLSSLHARLCAVRSASGARACSQRAADAMLPW
jgi:prohibitin 1